MRRSTVFILFVLTAFIFPDLQVRADQLESRADALFSDFTGDVPGATVAVFQNGKIRFAKSYGLAVVDKKLQAQDNTDYRIASVSKQFTAMAVMICKDRGMLSYDDPITQYLPDLPDIAKSITIRQLLAHTSGMIDYEDLIPADVKTQWKDQDVLEAVRPQQGVYFTPDTQYRYSNTGYALLALIVEKASGMDFASFAKKHIFEPLKMKDSLFYEKGKSTIPNRAMGYRKEGEKYFPADQSSTSAILGDGGVYTNVGNYLLWDQALYTSKLVSEKTLKEAFTPHKLANGKTIQYGFGWRIGERHGTPVIWHDGLTCGFSAAVRRAPEKKITVAVFANRNGKQVRSIADELMDFLLAGKPK